MKNIEIKKELNLQRFISNYVVANTPKYLYNHFRSNEVLFHLAKEYSITSLANNYRELVNKQDRSLEDVVAAYVILVSLTFLPYSDGVKAFKKFALSKLDWGKDVFEIYKSNSRTQNITTLNVGHQITLKELIQAKSAENSITTINMGSKNV